ncbi:MAG TPA: WD40 repeat domain-containing protein, partial [Pirellulales bacterium]|nr:WD40 repeat domain-containing protein [Pirellulales bacterium]
MRIWDVMTGKPHSVLRGHSRPVQSCSFSPDRRHVLSGAQEGEVKLWNILDYKEVRAPEGRVLAGHDDAILSAAFSPDGRRIVTGSRDHSARVYDVQSGNCLRWLREGHEFLASRAIFFSGGRLLLTAAGDDSVRIWDASSGSQLSVIEGTGRVAAVAVSADGKWIVTLRSDKHNRQEKSKANAGGENGEPEQGASPIALWALDASGRSPRPYALSNRRFALGHRGAVTAVAIAPDGRWLFSGDDAGVGKLWDAATGNEMTTLKGHAAGITDAWFLPSGQRLLTSSQDGSVRQWDVAAGRALPSTLAQRDSSELPVTAMALSSDGRRVLTLAEDVKDARQGLVDTIIRLWDVERASVVFEVYRGPETFTSIAFADGDQAALAASTRRDAPGALGGSVVRRWNLQTRREVLGASGGPYLDFTGRHESVWSAIAAADGASILTVGGKGAALWNPRSADSAEVVFKPHGAVSSASFSRDGKLVVSASTDRRAKIWNVETGRSELQLPAEHGGPITSAAFSATDDRLLLTAGLDGTARIWDFRARHVLQTLSHERGGSAPAPIRAAIFSANGKKVLTASDDGTVGIWETDRGQRAGTLQLGAPALCVASSPDGRQIMVGGANGKAVLFDAETGKPLLRYLGHTAAINQVAFSPDGRRVLSGSSDRLVKLWDVAVPDASSTLEGTGEADAAASEHEPPGGREILTLKHHDDAVTSVAFSPDGRAVLSAGL